MFSLPLLLLLLPSVPILTVNALSLDFDLIHRDSPLSPFHNSSSTPPELTQQVISRSTSRYKHRHRHLIQSDILPPIFFEEEGEYLFKLFIGSPPVQTWAIADTGSDLIWVQCSPCVDCYPQDSPIFNPFTSSTYKIVSCHSKTCRSFPAESACGISTQCLYEYGYGDGSSTKGELARDLVRFRGESKSDGFKRPLLFGCGHYNDGQFSSKGSGLVGLGNGAFSLVSQLGPEIDYKFAYCLVPYFSKSTGKLKLGKEAKISGSPRGVSTPFVTDSDGTNYFLTLEGVTIGNKTMKTSPKRKGNTLIDSGATWFLMEPTFYTKMEAMIKKAIGVKEVRKPAQGFSLCYSNKHYKTIMKNFPKFVVHFEGADVALKPDQNIFFRQEHLLCLGIFPEDDSTSYKFDYGNLPQVNFQVEYDLKAKTISFAHADCGKH